MSGLDKKRQLIRDRNRTEALSRMMKTFRIEGLPFDHYRLAVKVLEDLRTAGYSIHRFKHRTFNER